MSTAAGFDDSEEIIEKWLIVLDRVFRADRPPRDDEFKDVYCSALRDLDSASLDVAFGRCLRELRFYPTVSEIRERAPAQNKLLLSEQAWNEVWRQVEKYGSYRKHFPEAPAFDPATEYALRQVGGYLYLCSVGVNDRGESPLSFIRRDFLQAFDRFVSEGGAQLFLSQAQAAAELRHLTEARQAGRLLAAPAAAVGTKSPEDSVPTPPKQQKTFTDEDWQRRIVELRQQIKTTEGEPAK